MKVTLAAIMSIALVSILVGAGTFAYISDIESSDGNALSAGIIDLNNPADAVINVNSAYPGYSTGIIKIYLDMNPISTIVPDHMEMDVDTYDFVDGIIESGGVNTQDEYKKQIEVITLWYYDGISKNLLPLIDDSADGNVGFKSLYDVEAYGVFDDLPAFGTFETGRLEVNLSLPDDLPDADDNKYQKDSIKIKFEFAAIQESGQDVLQD